MILNNVRTFLKVNRSPSPEYKLYLDGTKMAEVTNYDSLEHTGSGVRY